MTLKQAIEQLTKLLEKHGNVELETDCSFCGKCTAPDKIVVGPPVATLKGKIV